LFQTEEPSQTGFLGESAEVQPLSFPNDGEWNLLLGEGLRHGDEDVRAQVETALRGKIKFLAHIEVDYADGNEHVLKSLLKSKDGVVIAIPAEINPVDAIAVTLQTFLHAAPSKDNVIILFGPETRLSLWRRWLREKQLGFDLLGVKE
jgi:hypothetical protein